MTWTKLNGLRPLPPSEELGKAEQSWNPMDWEETICPCALIGSSAPQRKKSPPRAIVMKSLTGGSSSEAAAAARQDHRLNCFASCLAVSY